MVLHDFATDLAYSHTEPFPWHDVYRWYFPAFVDCQAVDDLAWQRLGVDRVLTFPDGQRIYVDEKLRRRDYGDICLEGWSNYDDRVPGWAARDDLLTDYVAYGIAPTGQAYLIPFRSLRQALHVNGSAWWQWGYDRVGGFRLVEAHNAGSADKRPYVSYSVAVPMDSLWRALGWPTYEGVTSYV